MNIYRMILKFHMHISMRFNQVSEPQNRKITYIIPAYKSKAWLVGLK